MTGKTQLHGFGGGRSLVLSCQEEVAIEGVGQMQEEGHGFGMKAQRPQPEGCGMKRQLLIQKHTAHT